MRPYLSVGAGGQDGNGLIHGGQQRPQGQADFLTDRTTPSVRTHVKEFHASNDSVSFQLHGFSFPFHHFWENCFFFFFFLRKISVFLFHSAEPDLIKL